MNKLKLTVCEIFTSIQGETSRAGLPCTFVRLSGCNLSCSWCDTRYAANGGEDTCVADIIKIVAGFGVKLVSVTGGEPLLQAHTPALCEALCELGHTVMVETNGSQNIDLVKPPAIRIVDMKPPASGAAEKMDFNNLSRLRPGDEVKFIVADRNDFDWSVSLIKKYCLPDKTSVLMGGVAGSLFPDTLAEWILQSRLNIRLQVQLHKMLWPNRDRGV